jgi:hypothetical protein
MVYLNIMDINKHKGARAARNIAAKRYMQAKIRSINQIKLS